MKQVKIIWEDTCFLFVTSSGLEKAQRETQANIGVHKLQN